MVEVMMMMVEVVVERKGKAVLRHRLRPRCLRALPSFEKAGCYLGPQGPDGETWLVLESERATNRINLHCTVWKIHLTRSSSTPCLPCSENFCTFHTYLSPPPKDFYYTALIMNV